jgi:hypothetical protein
MNKEEFRDIPGYEGYYQVSNKGSVLSFHGKQKQLKQTKSTAGYYYVTLSVNNNPKKIHIHQLVAMAFLGHTICGLEKVIDHIDFNKTNNDLSNLRIVTFRENISRGRKNKTSKYVGVHLNKTTKKWVASIKIAGKKMHLGYFTSETKARLRYESQLRLVNC